MTKEVCYADGAIEIMLMISGQICKMSDKKEDVSCEEIIIFISGLWYIGMRSSLFVYFIVPTCDQLRYHQHVTCKA